MTSDSTRPSPSPFQAQTELELLQLILPMTEQAYPWNPSDPKADAYFIEVEQEVNLADWMAEELSAQGQTLASRFEHLWSTLSPAVSDAAPSLLDELVRRFSAQVPQSFLEGIVQRAQQAVVTQRSLADQLVSCVQDLLPAWSEDDLYVLARPLAYAMRQKSEVESELAAIQAKPWTTLSSLEQAKLSLEIAHYTISSLPPVSSLSAKQPDAQ